MKNESVNDPLAKMANPAQDQPLSFETAHLIQVKPQGFIQEETTHGSLKRKFNLLLQRFQNIEKQIQSEKDQQKTFLRFEAEWRWLFSELNRRRLLLGSEGYDCNRGYELKSNS